MTGKISTPNFPKRPMPAKTMPLDIGAIHFVGIGGIGMSGIAEILHNMGYEVQGSDANANANVERLQKMGIDVKIGQKAENVKNAAVVVKSTAVKNDNPEIKAARKNKIPVVKRSEMLAELTGLKATIAIAGTHGKTTTTSLVGRVLDEAGLDPTVINGGIINAYGTNARLGSGDWMVAEADESDGTFIKIPATAGIITNIDPEHLDYWGDYDSLKAAFKTFLKQMPFYGFAVLCADNKEVKKLAKQIKDRRIITYGIKKDADIRATNIKHDVGGSRFDAEINEQKRTLKGIKLSAPGQHNVLNALAAIAVGLELKIDDKVIISAFKNFEGVKRRFTKTGEVGGITIIDDYGHHPTEIAATLKAGKEVVNGGKGKIIAVVQPHRYSRLKNLFDEFLKCFKNADKVIVADVYEAGEKPIKGIDKEHLVKALKENGVDATALKSREDLAETVNEMANSGDLVICLGAGSITLWAQELPKELEELRDPRVAV